MRPSQQMAQYERLKKFKPIQEELEKATEKHPEWPKDIFVQTAIVSEEAGEMVRAVLHSQYEGGSIADVKKELIQTAAMCMRMLENLKG